MKYLLILFGIFAVSAPLTSRADEPLAPPKEVRARSANQDVLAISMPRSKTTVVFSNSKGTLWNMPGWFRWIYVANDGQHAVTGYDGANLLPLNYSEDWVLLTFWEKGKKLKELRVRDVIPDKSVLKRTASHFHWGDIMGIDRQNRLRIKRADGMTLLYDVKNGKRLTE